MILLEEDKLNELYEEYEKALGNESAEENWEIYVAKVQLKKCVEYLVGAGREEVLEDGTDNWYFGIPEDKWQALLKEIK